LIELVWREAEGSARAGGFLEEKEAHAATTIFLAALFSLEDAAPTPISLLSSLIASIPLCYGMPECNGRDQKNFDLMNEWMKLSPRVLVAHKSWKGAYKTLPDPAVSSGPCVAFSLLSPPLN